MQKLATLNTQSTQASHHSETPPPRVFLSWSFAVHQHCPDDTPTSKLHYKPTMYHHPPLTCVSAATNTRQGPPGQKRPRAWGRNCKFPCRPQAAGEEATEECNGGGDAKEVVVVRMQDHLNSKPLTPLTPSMFIERGKTSPCARCRGR